jgi:hypothetical protein
MAEEIPMAAWMNQEPEGRRRVRVDEQKALVIAGAWDVMREQYADSTKMLEYTAQRATSVVPAHKCKQGTCAICGHRRERAARRNNTAASLLRLCLQKQAIDYELDEGKRRHALLLQETTTLKHGQNAVLQTMLKCEEQYVAYCCTAVAAEEKLKEVIAEWE